MTRGNRGIIYFHFDPHDRVRDYVTRVLASLRPHADHILVVSNSPVDDVDLARLEASCDEVLQRPNEGLDVITKIGRASCRERV